MSAPCAFSERPKAKIPPSSSSFAARCLTRLVPAHPDRPEAEDRDLPRVPVPAGRRSRGSRRTRRCARCPSARRRRRRSPAGVSMVAKTRSLSTNSRKSAYQRAPVVVLELGLPLALEELDRLAHHLAGALVGVGALVVLGVQQDRHRRPSSWRGGSYARWGRVSHNAGRRRGFGAPADGWTMDAGGDGY